jgi:hypothetical protein
MTRGAVIPAVATGIPAALRRRCARHEEREAVGRCSVCAGGFCRECVTEHEDRLYCGPCFTLQVAGVRRVAAPSKFNGRFWRRLALTLGSLVCLVAGAYALGRLLAAIPADFHDGQVWKKTFGQ